MAQFDVYRNLDPESHKWAPYLVDLQHDMLSALATRVVAPLIIATPSAEPVIQRLNPVVPIQGSNYFLSTTEMASIPINELSQPTENLSPYRDELLAAIDLIFTAV